MCFYVYPGRRWRRGLLHRRQVAIAARRLCRARACRPAPTLGGIKDRLHLGAILDRLAARGIPALLSGMIAPPNLGADYGRELAAVFPRLAAARPGVIFDPFFLDGVAGDPALNQPDMIHPNAAGVAVIVARLLPAVAALLARLPRPPAG